MQRKTVETDVQALAVLVTDGTDTAVAESPEALTLLQLVQAPPIDMGSILRYEALSDLTGIRDTPLLGAVIVAQAGKDAAAPFAATLLAGA